MALETLGGLGWGTENLPSPAVFETLFYFDKPMHKIFGKSE